MNRISAVLTDANLTDIDGSVTDILTILTFLIKLEEGDRHQRIMGEKYTGYVSTVNNSCNVVSSALPSSFDLPEFNKDWALIDKLEQIKTMLNTRLNEKLEDTILQLRHELIEQADHGYGLLKFAAEKGNETVKLEVKAIAQCLASLGNRYPSSVFDIAGGQSVLVNKTTPASRIINVGNTILDVDAGPELHAQVKQATIRINPGSSAVL
ncbi:MAG: hypothetical protein WCH34_09170, partial [Bacteroidota bacterium]